MIRWLGEMTVSSLVHLTTIQPHDKALNLLSSFEIDTSSNLGKKSHYFFFQIDTLSIPGEGKLQ